MYPAPGSPTARLNPATGTWSLARPTSAGFEVGNFGVKRVRGAVPIISTRVEVAPDASIHSVDATLDLAAVDTGNTKRDSDLRKPSLLDLDRHPHLTFTSSRVTPYEGRWVVVGLLTVKGATREVSLEGTVERLPEGAVRVRLAGRLDRRDYAITAPRFLIGSMVDVDIDVTLVPPQ